MVLKRFYSELGKLLYAVADIDGMISKQEKETIENIVKKELVPTEAHKDEFGTDVAWYADIEFDFLDEQIADPVAALESFIDFVDEHRTAIDPSLKSVCLKIAERLAQAYSGTSKKEAKLIAKLKESLGKIEFRPNEKFPPHKKKQFRKADHQDYK